MVSKFVSTLLIFALVAFSAALVSAQEVPFRFVSIASASTRFNFTDDSSVAFSSPFTFNFFNGRQGPINAGTTFFVSSNGFVTFTNAGTTSLSPQIPIPNTAAPNNAVYGFWADLNPSAGGNIYVGQRPSINGPAGELVIEYNNVPFFSSSATATFQIALFQGTSCAEFRYASVSSPPVPYNVGIENFGGTEAWQWRTLNFPIINRSIRICTGLGFVNTITGNFDAAAAEAQPVDVVPADDGSVVRDETAADKQ